ncbi:MAG: efflux RND transporter periplasmic adaptor subunit [Gemmataceae bacterium]|nr:efflux RND transporter periplasmic adaptor subunit [Gemmataceae bacterium]
MNSLPRLASAVLSLALAVAVLAGAWWLVTHKPQESKTEKPAPPANVSKVVKEEDLNTILLTEEAEGRIGLKLGRVEKKSVRRVRVYGGEVTIPVGRTILVAAPLGGMLKAPTGGIPAAGQTVKAGQEILQLLPLLTPDGRATLSASLAEADGQVNTAKTQVELSQIALDRAKKVLKEGAGSQRQVDESQAAFELATKTLTAMSARRAILAKVVGDVEAGTTAPIAIPAPQDGIIRTVSALPGQTVPSGAALFEIADLSTLWVRVPLPVGDLDGIDRMATVQVGKLSGSTTNASAKPVAAPPSANALASTVDLFYELPNEKRSLMPGQRLGVTVPLADEVESPTVPWSALVFDIHGGTWLYEAVGSRSYVRRRAVVRYTTGPDAVLASGPPVGTSIVTEGVQQLFGAETGFIK